MRDFDRGKKDFNFRNQDFCNTLLYSNLILLEI